MRCMDLGTWHEGRQDSCLREEVEERLSHACREEKVRGFEWDVRAWGCYLRERRSTFVWEDGM